MTQPAVLATRPVVERHTTAEHLNVVVNHPDVRPWVLGPMDGYIDLTPLVEDERNILLMGEWGGIMFHCCQGGLYEAHTQVMPQGRGRWCVDMVRQCLHWVFTRTGAVEVITRVPRGNIAALALTRMMGGQLEWTQPDGWVVQGRVVPADLHSLSVQQWMGGAHGLVARGRHHDKQVRRRLATAGHELQVRRLADDNYLRYIGACFDMILGGQPGKGVALYNRWAHMAGYGMAQVVATTPLIIEFSGHVTILITGSDYQVLPCPSQRH